MQLQLVVELDDRSYVLVMHTDETTVRRGEWEVRQIPHAPAKALIEETHYTRSCPRTAIRCDGLFRSDDDQLLGAVLWLPPTPPAARSVAVDWHGVASCSRLAIAPEVPLNGASFLLGRSMRTLERRWSTLLTYADTAREHTGAIYRATNWTFVGQVPGGERWIGPDGAQSGRKKAGRNITRRAMRDAGFTMITGAPLLKFVYHRR